MTSFDFLTDKANLLHTRWADSRDAAPRRDSAVVALERFAFTANNLTYAKLGEALRYWEYFPASPPWGRTPVWGIGTVTKSLTGGLVEGERVYGFFPISERIVLSPDSGDGDRFVDATPHRSKLPPTYNEYVRIDRDRDYDPAFADAHLVLRPLFSLGFFLAAWLDEHEYFGGRRVIVSSASSKTAAALAEQLQGKVERVGLTDSPRRQFVVDGGRFERVVDYCDLETDDCLDGSQTVFVDIAGDPAIRRAIHERLGATLVRSISVGATRGGIAPRSFEVEDDLPGPKPQPFFAPNHILHLRERWGADVLRDRVTASLAEFMRRSASSFQFEVFGGKSAITRVYDAVARGAGPTNAAAILTDPGRD